MHTPELTVDAGLLLTGIGLRTPHFAACLADKPSLAWLEVHSENFFADGGKALHTLTTLRKTYPISLHGVGLSLAGTDDIEWQHLKQLRDLITRINPCLVSDHLAWSQLNGQYFHDLLPFPFTSESANHVIARIQHVQDYLQRPILIENISSYVQFRTSTYAEADWIALVAERAGCGILLDVSNVYVSCTNHGLDPQAYFDAIPAKAVQELHLGGFSKVTLPNGREVLLDTHNAPIAAPVWDWFRYVVQTLGRKPTIIEWDDDLPSLDTLYFEACRAEIIQRKRYDTPAMSA